MCAVTHMIKASTYTPLLQAPWLAYCWSPSKWGATAWCRSAFDKPVFTFQWNSSRYCNRAQTTCCLVLFTVMPSLVFYFYSKKVLCCQHGMQWCMQLAALQMEAKCMCMDGKAAQPYCKQANIAMCNLLLFPAALWHQANPLCNMGTLFCTLHHEQCQQVLPADNCLEHTM